MSVAAPPAREHLPPAPTPAPAPAPPAPAPAAPGPLASASARVSPPTPTPLPPGAPAHELDVRGGAPLEAPGEVVDYVKSKGDAGAPVRVRVGSVAAGQITVVARGTHLHTRKTQGVPLLLPLFSPLRTAGIEPVLALDVHDKAVDGYASARVGDRVLSKSGGLAGKLREHADLIGWAGLDKLSLPDLTNELQDGNLVLKCSGLSFEVGGFLDAKGSFGMTNEVVTFTATATGKVPGLATITVPIERKEDGSLAGKVTVDLTIKGFTGQLEASYAHGVVDVIGTVRYANEKFDGSVTIAATDKDNAKALTAAHTPAEVKTAAPAAEGATPHEGSGAAKPAAAPPAATAGPAPGSAVAAKKGPRVLVGWGTVNIRLAEWLTGEAVVLVDADGDVTIVGKITPRMTKPLFEQRDWKYALPKLEVRAAYGIPVVGNIFVFANVGLEALAKLGPATLTNMEMTGTWSTKPSVLQSFGLTGTLNISAFAGLRLIAEGGVGLEILDHDIKVGVALSALAGIRGYVDATPRIGYREVADPAAGKKGEFYIGGHLDIAAQPFLQLGGDFFVDLDSPWWSPAPDKRWTWPLGQLEYPLPGEFGIGADVEHVLGSGKMPEIQFGKVDFNASRFMTDLVDDHVPPKKSTDEQKKGGWKESQPAAAAAPAAPAPAATGKALPTGPAGAPPKVDGAPPKPGAAPKVGGPSGKTSADAAQTPKPENDAKVKKAMEVYAAQMKEAKAHPEGDGEMAHTLSSLKAAGFTSADAKREGTNWHVKASINMATESVVPAIPGGSTSIGAAYFAGQPTKRPAVSKGDEITMGSDATLFTVTDVRQVKREIQGASGLVWVIEYDERKKRAAKSTRDAYVDGKDNFKIVVPSKLPLRSRNPNTSQSQDRGIGVSYEVGVSVYQDPKQDPAGWELLGEGSAAWWDRIHLLSGWLDGPGERWNLVNAPRKINSEMYHDYEKDLIKAARANVHFHFEAHVDYHGPNDDPQLSAKRAANPNYDPSKFPKTVRVRVKALGPLPSGLADPSIQKPYGPIRLPDAPELAGYSEPSKVPPPIVRKKGSSNSPT